MISGVAAPLSNYFSQISFHKTQLTHPLETNLSFARSFNILGWSSIVASLLLALLFPFLKKTHPRKETLRPPNLVR